MTTVENKSVDIATPRLYVEQTQPSSKSSNALASDKSTDDFYFGKFCKHVPRILRRQLVGKLVNEYMQNSAETIPMDHQIGVNGQANSPNIVRFHGALLFVDISGFTVLSQKLKVDELKNQINAYFQKIVDIINKYDGEIIKFAGDALFIIWQTKTNDIDNEEFLPAAREAAESAANCGIEINLECGNYPIALQGKRRARKSKPGNIQLKKGEVLYTSTGNDALAQGILDLNNSLDDPPASVPAVLPSLSVATQALVPPRPASTTGTTATVTPTSAHKTTPKSSGSVPASKAASSPKSKVPRKRREPTVTYLNVHAGVSMGVMAGMDVGANNRFEYLLLGRPMNEVAIAEGDAGTGEIVISPAVHALLHNYASLKTSGRGGALGGPAVEDSSHPLSCGCTRTGSGFYKIRNSLDDMLCAVDFGAPSPGKSSGKAPIYVAPADVEFEGDADLQYEYESYAHVIEELMSGYKAISPEMSARFGKAVRAALEPSTPANGSRGAAAIEYTEKEVMMEHFFGWAQHCLLDDIAKHVHEVVRKGYSFYQERRAAPFEHFLSSPACIESFRNQLALLQGGAGADQSARNGEGSILSPRSSITNLSPKPDDAAELDTSRRGSHHRNLQGRAHGDSFVSKMRQLTGLSTLREKKQTKHQQVLSKDGTLVSELRNVIVLFISVKIDNAGVFLDPLRDSQAAQAGSVDAENIKMVQTCKVDSFHFLSRTVDEIEADKKLINQFQGCMEVLTDVFHTKGGQLRQFIVDDKGTVAIGTFGLRGSVNYDNAAAAVDAADLIIAQLQDLGLNASVGVTSGAAYCGWVGSETRHEYAVMGPSTNLSARLMGRAQEGEIICDSAIRQRDRAHTYTSLGAVKAKGYANLVPIFKPQFGVDDNGNSLQFSLVSRQSSAKGMLSKQMSRLVLRDPLDAIPFVFGRRAEARELGSFLFCDIVKGSTDELWGALWKPRAQELPANLQRSVVPLAPFAINNASSAALADLNKDSPLCKEQMSRFDISKPAKLTVVVAPNGLGKTALLDLLHLKLNRLALKNKAVYNIAVFRHQEGPLNSTTILSAWYSLVRQALFSIAETVAESGAAQSAQCLEAVKDDDCGPVVAFLCDYLPPELRPFTPLLALVGVPFESAGQRHTSSKVLAVELMRAVSAKICSDGSSSNIAADRGSHVPQEPCVASSGDQENATAAAAADLAEPPVTPDLLGGAAINTESHKGDLLETLDPAERLQRCAELVVAIVQLHVKITRKLTFYLMDDVQQQDPASQDLCRLIHAGTTGVCLLCTYRSGSGAADANAPTLALQDKASSRLPATPDGAPATSFSSALQTMAQSSTFHRLNLQPLTAAATKKLFAHVFAEYGIQDAVDGTFSKLYALSGGSPLYASELAKGICDRYIHREVSAAQPGNGADRAAAVDDAVLAAIIDDLRTDRIEEIVHFRFDKLTEQCQLVLKMAAVASANGSYFTLPMLTWILDSTRPIAEEAVAEGEASDFDAMIRRAASHMGLLDAESDPEDACGFEQRGMTLSGKARWSSSIDLVAALNDLLASEQFIEASQIPEHDWEHHAASQCDGGIHWLASAGSTSSKVSASLKTDARPPFVADSPKHLEVIEESAQCSKHGSNSDSFQSSTGASSRDRSALQQLRFHWKVDMELRAIYDLMLDEQKESLHDRVASYLEETAQKSDLVTATVWFQQGFHWERATNWSSAMTCYYQAGMLLRDQGDTLGCKSCFTEAFRMLDKMKNEAGIRKFSAPVGSAAVSAVGANAPSAVDSTTADPAAIASAAAVSALSNPELQLHLALGGQQSGLTAQDLYKLYEGDANLLHTGFSLIVRVAQGLVGFGTGALSLQLYEEAIEMMRVLSACAEPLVASDGLPFELRNKDICFIVLSGIFMLLLSGQAKDDAQHSRIQAAVALSIQIARSKPEYAAHLVMALSSKLKMLDLFQAANPAIAPGIIFTADELMGLYKPVEHSRDLVYYYGSDRAGNALGVVMKLLCLRGHFAQNLKYLDHAKQIAAEMGHFYSLSIGILVLFPMLLMYHSDSQAQVLYERYMKTERKQRNNDFRDGAAIWMEWIAQTHKFEALKTNFDESQFSTDSAVVEHIIQAKVFVQAQESQFYLNLLRLHCIGVEYALASICYLKALRYELLARHHGDPSLHRDKVRAYLELGLLHLTFSPQQVAMNQMFLFSNLHEKLLRAQLLMKSVEYCDLDGTDTIPTANASVSASASADKVQGSGERRAQLWQQALENLQYCAAAGRRGDYHTVLLLTGRHLQTLSALQVTGQAPPSLTTATNAPTASSAEVHVASADTSNDGAAGHSAGAEAPQLTHTVQMAQLAQADVQMRAALHAQGAALQEQALQYLRTVNGEEIFAELVRKKLKISV